MRPLPTTLALFGAALGFVVILAPDAPLLGELYRARMSGWVALSALLGSLSTPLLSRFGRVGPWRRALGLTAALFSTLHAAFVLPTDLVFDLRLLIYEPQLRAGAATLFALLVLAVTSFGAVARRVPRWKDLHALAYVAGGLAALHLALSPHAWPPAPLAVVGLLVVGFLVRAADRKRW